MSPSEPRGEEAASWRGMIGMLSENLLPKACCMAAGAGGTAIKKVQTGAGCCGFPECALGTPTVRAYEKGFLGG